MPSDQSVCIIIPARAKSTRLPGKPLQPLLGKPMVLWVAEACARAVPVKDVYIATDSQEIAQVVHEGGFQAIMTSANAMTGTDRTAEAAEKLDYDIYINVQGDEPLVDPENIRRAVALKRANPNKVVNAFALIGATENPSNVNIPKVVVNERKEMLYMSRAAIPAGKSIPISEITFKKQICIYGFSLEELQDYRSFGRKSAVEAIEDIEILRFVELGKAIIMFEAVGQSVAVDVIEDVPVAENMLKERFGPWL
ncbi:MAG: 3-deoxy-manno-octulosonate cytidylyltransferase [Litorimonas sp.]